MIDTPQIIQAAAQRTAFIHLIVTREEMQRCFGATIGELMSVLAAQGVAPAGPIFAHHLRRPMDTFDFELSVPVSAPVKPAGRVQPGERPAMCVARTIHHGPYEELPEAWGEFMDWVEKNAPAITQDFYECYLTNPDANPDPATWQSELSRPLAEPNS